MGGVLQYKWEVYCCVSLSLRLRSQEGPAIQMGGAYCVQIGGVLPYFFETSRGWGFRNSSEIRVTKQIGVMVGSDSRKPSKVRLHIANLMLSQ